MLDGEKTKLNSEVNDLQNRVARDEEREEESRKESFGLKQKVGYCNEIKAVYRELSCSYFEHSLF